MTDDVSRLEALQDKVDGLEEDLDSALGIIFQRGDREAINWLWLNYPKKAREMALQSVERS